MGKKHHSKFKSNDENCKIDDQFAEEIFKELCERAKQRRIIIRKPTGEVVTEMPLIAGVIITTLLTIFLFPAVVIAIIAGYRSKVRVDIISEITDEEAVLVEQLERQQTVVGLQNDYYDYEVGDGQQTLIQDV